MNIPATDDLQALDQKRGGKSAATDLIVQISVCLLHRDLRQLSANYA